MEEFFPVPLASTAEYLQNLGVFHSNWSAIDLHVDYAIFQFLKITPVQAHLITGGLMFGRKARLLDDLIRHSKDTRKQALLTALNKIRASKRDVLTHSYVKTTDTEVSFIEKNTSGPTKVKVHTFTHAEFYAHVRAITDAAYEFIAALEVSREDLHDFAETALSLASKSSTFPDKP